MASAEEIHIIKKGPKAWNEWRLSNPVAVPLLAGVDLAGSDLSGINLEAADLREAKLDRCNLARASLMDANLSKASLKQADLTNADLRGTILLGVDLTGSRLAGATLGDTVFANVDLNTASGLEACRHVGPSSIDFASLVTAQSLNHGFLLGCGLPDIVIDYLPALIAPPIRFSSYFLSYAQSDKEFAQRLHSDLRSLGIRSWFAPQELRVGENLHTQLGNAIRHTDKIVLVLSQASARSEWVRWEVEKALEIERETNRTVLIPIRLDDYILESKQAWSAQLRERFILDFSNWRESGAYQQAVGRFAKDLALTLAAEEVER